ncbi:N-acetylglucosamine kinase [Inhella proteolytica]|uniref:ATPase n=1 Tax=Inhella proteolytica TaxID=2795029 RepID=A0A931NGC7_9BURK|nr:BadF/BadG/BcrA/BcrD ATPase family protein [Inhella proteolytica]MBH9576558.1 ATPase [Inhella proteolytica]
MKLLSIGLDAGGTQTRWAAVNAQGSLCAEGEVAPISGLLLADPAKRQQLQQALSELAEALAPLGRAVALYGGITGVAEPEGPVAQELNRRLAEALQIEPARVACHSDMDIAYRAAFAPGAGYLVYAGTGAIAVHLDAAGQLHRAGGRGYLLGDEGGGYWIAREALATVWRREDEAPESWRESPLACALFERLGGADWARSRQFMYGGDRGSIGRLALAVAEAASTDPQARALLRRAGTELARLPLSLSRRFGAKPVLAAGRALLLHPLVLDGLREALPPSLPLTSGQLAPHTTAAQLAHTLLRTR